MTEYALETKIQDRHVAEFFSQYYQIEIDKISIKKSLNEHFDLRESDPNYNPNFVCANEHLSRGFATYFSLLPDRLLGNEDVLCQAMANSFDCKVLSNCYDEEAMYGFYLFVPNGKEKKLV